MRLPLHHPCLWRDNHGIVWRKRTEVAEVEGVESGAIGAAGSDKVKRIVDGTAGEVQAHGQLHGFAVMIGVERNDSERREDALLDEAFDGSGRQTGLERQCRQCGKKLGYPVCGEVPLDCPRLCGLETGESEGVVGVLLEECRH